MPRPVFVRLPQEQARRVRAASASLSAMNNLAEIVCHPAGFLAEVTQTRKEVAAVEQKAVKELGQAYEVELRRLGIGDGFICSSVSCPPRPAAARLLRPTRCALTFARACGSTRHTRCTVRCARTFSITTRRRATSCCTRCSPRSASSPILQRLKTRVSRIC